MNLPIFFPLLCDANVSGLRNKCNLMGNLVFYGISWCGHLETSAETIAVRFMLPKLGLNFAIVSRFDVVAFVNRSIDLESSSYQMTQVYGSPEI